jgi:hypothetical protein
MKTQNLIIWLIPIFICSISCNTVDPNDDDDNSPPGRRDYFWSIDSISGPGFPYLASLWGSSSTDVWGAGFSEDVRDCLWHYDGTSWKRATEGTPITEFGNGSKSVGGVWGTAQNDVWAFGGRLFSDPERTEPFVMHYNGNQWLEVVGDISQMPDGYTDIYAIRKDHFWISSSDHVSEYKDGLWKKYFIGENYFVQSISGIGNSVYLTAYPIGLDSLYLMKLQGNEFIIIDRTKLLGNAKFEQSGLCFANNKLYTFGGNGVFTSNLKGEEIVQNSWVNELELSSGMGFWSSYKISSKDIFAIGHPSIAYHYNGDGWGQLFINPQYLSGILVGIWGNGKEVFISDIENGILYHGK